MFVSIAVDTSCFLLAVVRACDASETSEKTNPGFVEHVHLTN
jgi:hypothetical protein